MFFQFCFMKRIITTILSLSPIFSCAIDTLGLEKTDTSLIPTLELQDTNIYEQRLRVLDSKTPMDLTYNDKVQPFIDAYLGRDKTLISKMKALKQLYFPLFEQQLDNYGLPLEFKYLAIVESALNPQAKSYSGATGLWQFMYLTGKEYGLDVTSYVDERKDPLKSTQAACEYFVKLYDIFGDWNLVLAAYNGGPGYLQRKINSEGTYDFWKLYPHLRRETRNYIPTFIAVNYVMNYSGEHNIISKELDLQITKTDTLTIKEQATAEILVELLCVNKETIEYLNPSYKKNIFPKNTILTLPEFAINDFLNNEQANYAFINAVYNKEILINEKRIVYNVEKGDYLGKIANEFGVKIFELKQWNNLLDTDLNINDKLVVYVKNKKTNDGDEVNKTKKNEYIVQPGDTLWGIANKHNGVSVWKIKSLNNLESDNISPGTKIILPNI